MIVFCRVGQRRSQELVFDTDRKISKSCPDLRICPNYELHLIQLIIDLKFLLNIYYVKKSGLKSSERAANSQIKFLSRID
jgi:hypothetical protein